MAPLIAFDVNETLLDLAALDPLFARVFGDPAVRREWFAQMLQSMFISIVTDRYADFTALQMGALTAIAARHDVAVSEDDRRQIREGMQHLPPHPDVRPALERLRGAGLRLVTLTNSPEPVARAQIANAGLGDLFEAVFSADRVRRLKPAPESYRMVAERGSVPIGQVRLVAAHGWDIAGALRAGCAAAFVARPRMALDPIAERPEIVGDTLGEVAEQIIAVDQA